MNVPHPIPYQGSKRSLAPIILSYFPKDVRRLVEPFAGSAAVSLLAAARSKRLSFALNDLNKPLVHLWQQIIERPDVIADAYETLWNAQLGHERAYYDLVRGKFNQTQEPGYLLYLLARCVKAAIRYNAKGEFNQSPDNRRLGAKPSLMRSHIIRTSRLFFGRVNLKDGDYRDVLADTSPEDVVYMDPPYQGVCGKRDPRYVGGFTFSGFVEALAQLNSRSISYIVSYDGRTGTKTYGDPLPASLGLVHIMLEAGPSSQATLLGRQATTFESLYLSPALVSRLDRIVTPQSAVRQLQLFGSEHDE